MSQRLSDREVLASIRSAFPDENPPSGEASVSKTRFREDLERNAIRSFLGGRRWTAITMWELETYRGDRSAILSFLSPVGFCYYLPAFLTVCVTDFLKADVLVATTFLKFTPHADPEVDEYWRRVNDDLSLAQLEVIAKTARFLELCHGEDEVLHAARINVEGIIATRRMTS